MKGDEEYKIHNSSFKTCQFVPDHLQRNPSTVDTLRPDEVSCIERGPHFRGKFLLRKHIWFTAKCPEYRGVLISGVSF